MPASVLLGLDDTDMLDTPGTNHLARQLVRLFGRVDRPSMVTRHQLLKEPRVPCTRQNGCVCVRFETTLASPDELFERTRDVMRSWCPAGSDPGLCATTAVPGAIVEFGRRCQREFVRQRDARILAAENGIRLEGLGGTEDGVIGALAAVGLNSTGNDGRVVHFGPADEEPFEINGTLTYDEVRARSIAEVLRYDDHSRVTSGTIHIEKKLRPNLRDGRIVLYVLPNSGHEHGVEWQTVRVV